VPVEIHSCDEGEGRVLVLSGTLDAQGAAALLKRALPSLRRGEALTVDLANVEWADSAGVAALAECLIRSRERGARLSARGASPRVREVLGRTRAPGPAEVASTPQRPGVFERLGGRALQLWAVALGVLQFLATTSYWCVVAPLKRRFPPRGETALQAVRIGVNALPLVGLIALLLGLIMAFQSAFQLRQFGASIFVADLVGVGMVRELGPLITAIVVAGRSGSAIAAELGTMVIGEEIDALRTMGINETRFLVVPRLYAITITQPALTLLANVIGVFGGFLIGCLYLELSPVAYIRETQRAIHLGDLVSGLSKSVIFAWIIALVGCHCGLSLRGGADAVGRATTASVVGSIFLIIVADSIMTTVSTLLGAL
jgi:phospholipid/cholesterol/gamma-HCH transport system permease protein